MELVKAAQKEAGIKLGKTTNTIKDAQRASEAERRAHRRNMEASLPTSKDGWNDVPSMLERFERKGIFNGPVYPGTEMHVKYLEWIDLTRRAAEARDEFRACPSAFLLKLLEQCEKIMATVSDEKKPILSTAVQGFKQQLGFDLVLLARALRSRGREAVCHELPLLGCTLTAEQIAKDAERFSRESLELLLAGATDLPPAAICGATGACRKNIANALGEQQEPNQDVIQALRMSAKDSYTKGGVSSAATYHEIGVDMPTYCKYDIYSQVDVPLASEREKSQEEQSSFPADEGRAMLCVICCEQPRAMIFQPCRHMVSCGECSGHCESCPVCRSSIASTDRVFT